LSRRALEAYLMIKSPRELPITWALEAYALPKLYWNGDVARAGVRCCEALRAGSPRRARWRGIGRAQAVHRREIAMSSTPTAFREIPPDAAFRARDKARVIDVREAGERRLDGFMPGAEHVPLASLEAEARVWDRGAELVLVCRSGNRSRRAAAALAAMGFRNVLNMTGGMLAYAAAGLPVARP
jgi:rhodanese-related sulfurtransferase